MSCEIDCNLPYFTSDIHEEVRLRKGDTPASQVTTYTVNQIFEKTVSEHHNWIALVSCEGKEYTFRDFYNAAKKYKFQINLNRFAMAMIHVGCETFTTCHISGFNAPEWIIAHFGAMLGQFVSAGIYATNSPEVCKYILKDCNGSVAVVDGKDQYEKYISICEDSSLKAIVVYNSEDVVIEEKYKGFVYRWEDFLKLGNDSDEKVFTERQKLIKPNQCCSVIYTSGTTSYPKGVMMSHDNIMVILLNAKKYFYPNGYNGQITSVSYLPLSHVAAQCLETFAALYYGIRICFADKNALKGTLVKYLRKYHPQMFFGVPRVYQKMQASILEQISKLGAMKKYLIETAMSKGMYYAQHDQAGNDHKTKFAWNLYNKCILSSLRKAIGLDKVQLCIVGGAPADADLVLFFRSLDIKLVDVYGASETTAIVSANHQVEWKAGSVGKSFAHSITKIDPLTHEILVFSRSLCMGYIGKPESNKALYDEDGWCHTGDTGIIDEDGFLFINGRLKEIIVTAGGENVPPLYIENCLRPKLPFCSNIMVIGDKKKFLSVLLTMKEENIDLITGVHSGRIDSESRKELAKFGCNCQTVEECRTCKALGDKIKESLSEYNKNESISKAQYIQKFVILPHDFMIKTGEMTATLKVKRHVVCENFKELIDEIYA